MGNKPDDNKRCYADMVDCGNYRSAAPRRCGKDIGNNRSYRAAVSGVLVCEKAEEGQMTERVFCMKNNKRKTYPKKYVLSPIRRSEKYFIIAEFVLIAVMIVFMILRMRMLAFGVVFILYIIVAVDILIYPKEIKRLTDAEPDYSSNVDVKNKVSNMKTGALIITVAACAVIPSAFLANSSGDSSVLLISTGICCITGSLSLGQFRNAIIFRKEDLYIKGCLIPYKDIKEIKLTEKQDTILGDQCYFTVIFEDGEECNDVLYRNDYEKLLSGMKRRESI